MQEHQCPAHCQPKAVGRVSHEERDEILRLFERKNGLLELVKSLAAEDSELLSNPHFYEKIVADLGQTTTQFQQWWENKSAKYQWENVPGHNWSIDFESCTIFLVK